MISYFQVRPRPLLDPILDTRCIWILWSHLTQWAPTYHLGGTTIPNPTVWTPPDPRLVLCHPPLRPIHKSKPVSSNFRPQVGNILSNKRNGVPVKYLVFRTHLHPPSPLGPLAHPKGVPWQYRPPCRPSTPRVDQLLPWGKFLSWIIYMMKLKSKLNFNSNDQHFRLR